MSVEIKTPLSENLNNAGDMVSMHMLGAMIISARLPSDEKWTGKASRVIHNT